MGTQELSDALLGYSTVLGFEPAVFLPTSDLSRRNLKQICQTIDRKYRKSVDFVHFICEPRDLGADGFHAVASSDRDRLDSRISAQSTQ